MNEVRVRAMWVSGAVAALVSLLGSVPAAAVGVPSPSPSPVEAPAIPEPTDEPAQDGTAVVDLFGGEDSGVDGAPYGALVADSAVDLSVAESIVEGQPLVPEGELIGAEDAGLYGGEQITAPATSIQMVPVSTEGELDAVAAASSSTPVTDSIVAGAAVPEFMDLVADVRSQSMEDLAMSGKLGEAYSQLPRVDLGDELRVSVVSQLGGSGAPGAAFTAEVQVVGTLEPAWVDIAFDVSGFEHAYGGDYGDRLFLVAVPECAATTPEVPSCWVGVPLETTHTGDGLLRAFAPAGSQSLINVSSGMGVHRAIDLSTGRLLTGIAADGLVMAAPSGKTIVAAVSGASSQAGTFRATDLAPRGTWGVTEPEGGFTYSIPISVPPTSTGGAPGVALTYSSQAVDGKTAASNSQAGVIGEGWSAPVNFIERLYKTCADDLGSGQELCWDSPYTGVPGEAAYVLSLQGQVQELVWRSTAGNVAEYTAVSDPTMIVRRHFNSAATNSNGDDDGEYFEVLTTDGSRFLFGYTPAGAVTNSVAWEPVTGNQAGEPGNGATNNRVLKQGYRFFLDLSVDASGNAATYFYKQAPNRYTVASASFEYVRDTQLERIEYGSAYDTPSDTYTDPAEAKVDFLLVKRCVDGAQFYDSLSTNTGVDSKCGDPSSATMAAYPDVPVDLICTGSTCGAGQVSPTYFTTLRLDRITTSVLTDTPEDPDTDLNEWVTVEDTQLITAYPTTTDGSARSLWLDAVYTQGYGDPTHPGAASTAPVRTYLTKFSGIHLNNRVDWDMTVGTAELPTRAMDHVRIGSVYTDMGGRIDVTYAQAGLSATWDANTALPLCPQGGKDNTAIYNAWLAANPLSDVNSTANDQLCFAVKQGDTTAIYHNYVVTRVDLVDAVGGQDTETHHYTYGGTPFYARADSMLYAQGSTGDTATHSSYRGFKTVTSWVGDGTQAPKSTNQYFRATGVSLVSLYDGSTQLDNDARLAGMLESSRTVNAQTETVAASRQDPKAAAVGGMPNWERQDGAFRQEHSPYVVLTDHQWSKSTDAGVTVTSENTTTYDKTQQQGGPAPTFLPVAVSSTTSDNHGSTPVTQCQQVDYASSTTPYLVVAVAARSFDGACGTGTRTGEVRVGYDSLQNTPGLTTQTLTRGLVTQEQAFSTAADAAANTPAKSTITTAEYSARGQITKAWLPLSDTSGSPSVKWEYGTEGLLLTTKVTRALGATSTTYTERGHGNTVKTHGVTDRDWTHYAYDGLGLLIAGWAPQQWGKVGTPDLTNDIPTVLYRYDMYTDGPSLRSTPVSVTTAPYVSAKWIPGTETTASTTTFSASALTGTTRRSITFLDGFGRSIEQHSVAQDRSGDRTVTATKYNSLGQVAWASAPFVEDAPVRVYDAQGVSAAKKRELSDMPTATQYMYDSLGRPTAVAAVAAGVSIKDLNGVESTTLTTYAGLTTTVTTPDGASAATTVDLLGRAVLKEVDPDVHTLGDVHQKTEYRYDTVTALLLAQGGLNLPQGLLSLTDAQRVGFQRVTVKDPDGADTVFESNLAGQRTLMVDPNAGATAYDYDDNGQTLSVRSAAGTIAMGYDVLGRLVSRETMDGAGIDSSSATWDYVVPGDVDEATDLGLLRSATSNTVTSVGTLTTVQGSVYNDLHQMVSSTVKLPDSTLLGDLSGTSYTTAVGYDGLGQPVSTTVGALGAVAQETVTTGYRLSGVAATLGVKQGDAGSMSAVMPLVTGVSFSGTGQLTSRSYADGLVRQYGWDSQTRALTAVVAQFPDLTSPLDAQGQHQYVKVQHDEFTRDVMGRITQSTNEVPVVDATAANGQVTAECFTYDGFNRLSAAWTVADASSPVCGGQAPASGTVGWDASGTAYQALWVYSLAGKIDALTQSVAAGVSAVTGYDYSSVHPAAVTSTTEGAATTGAFTYDGAGRMDSRQVDGVTTALDWDVTSSLVESGKPGTVGAASAGQGGHIVYAYDASGQRVAQAVVADATHTGSATAYVVSGEVTDQDTAVPAAASSLQATRYYSFGGSTVAVRTATGLALVLGDEQGSVSVTMPLTVDTVTGVVAPATIADAQNVTRTAYTPYGQLRGDDNLALSRGWLGQVEDRVAGENAETGTGLTYLNARYYDPATSRFISPDPLMNPGDPKTLDPYRYADNNPVVFTDASGLKPLGQYDYADGGTYRPTNSGTVISAGSPGAGKPSKSKAPKGPTLIGGSSTASAPSVWNYIPADAASCGPVPCLSATQSEKYHYPLGRTFDTAAYVGMGFVPGVGTWLDVIDFSSASAQGDPGLMALAAVGFLPFGDLAKLKRLRPGAFGSPAGVRRTLEDAAAAVPRPRGISNSVAQAALAHSNDSGLTVLGRFDPPGGGPNYIARADSEGASYFDLGVGRFSEADAQLADAYFMRVTVAKGDTVLVHGGQSAVVEGTWLSAEVSALKWYGYVWDGDLLIPPAR